MFSLRCGALLAILFLCEPALASQLEENSRDSVDARHELEDLERRVAFRKVELAHIEAQLAQKRAELANMDQWGSEGDSPAPAPATSRRRSSRRRRRSGQGAGISELGRRRGKRRRRLSRRRAPRRRAATTTTTTKGHRAPESDPGAAAESEQFISSLKLPKKCSGRPRQTRFPFTWGTISSYQVVSDNDHSVYANDLEPENPGRGFEDNFWDYRTRSWLTFDMWNFPLRMTCSFKYKHPYGEVTYKVKVRGNPNDFKNHAELKKQLTPYLYSMGRMPELMFGNLKQLTVSGSGAGGHVGAAAWMGDLTINLGRDMLRMGELFFHEATHLSLQPILNHNDYKKMIKADCNEFFSEYAKANPDREGMAESLLMYWALRYKPGRLSSKDKQNIIDTGPNRMKFFHDHIKEGRLLLPPAFQVQMVQAEGPPPGQSRGHPGGGGGGGGWAHVS